MAEIVNQAQKKKTKPKIKKKYPRKIQKVPKATTKKKVGKKIQKSSKKVPRKTKRFVKAKPAKTSSRPAPVVAPITSSASKKSMKAESSKLMKS